MNPHLMTRPEFVILSVMAPGATESAETAYMELHPADVEVAAEALHAAGYITAPDAGAITEAGEFALLIARQKGRAT